MLFRKCTIFFIYIFARRRMSQVGRAAKSHPPIFSDKFHAKIHKLEVRLCLLSRLPISLVIPPTHIIDRSQKRGEILNQVKGNLGGNTCKIFCLVHHPHLSSPRNAPMKFISSTFIRDIKVMNEDDDKNDTHTRGRCKQARTNLSAFSKHSNNSFDDRYHRTIDIVCRTIKGRRRIFADC